MAGRISTEDNTVRKLELPLQYLKDITDNFSSDREIGRGGFGVVYKGMEPQSEVVIAVKKLKPILGGQDKQFKNEVNHLARLSHDNIVKLVGYCDETKERPVYDEYQQKYILAEVQDRLLCYEYMSKGSLDKYIFDESIGLDWQDRYKIINGICQGLYCLHEGLDNTPIIHMDLKPCNILLDDRMEPKIADFGLSRFFSEEQTRTCTMNVIGSIGYMAPEYLHRGDISTKSDIYSLGILILEVVTGKKNSHVAGNMSGEHFIENVRKNWTEMSQIVLKYPSLGTDCHHQVHRCIETGLRCAEANPETRPSAGQILLHIFSGKSTSADKVDQETIKKQVASMYLWPKTLEVPIMDPSKASKRPVGILLVKVVRAQNLRKKNLLGKSDPYVELKMSDDKLPSKKTTVKRSNLNPEWNEEFKFLVTDPENQALEVNVFNWELVGKHERMGMNMIPLRELPPEETTVTTLNLLNTMDPNDVQNEKSRGQLTLELTYKPFKEEDVEKEDTEGADVIEKAPDGTPAGGGLLYVIVHGAQDLEGKHHTNPYAKIIFKGEAKKTRAIKRNRDPRWEDEFEFVCEEPPVNDKLHVEVLSKAGKIGLIHGKETLGYIYISLADVISNKRINEKYYLIDSKNGQIQIELKWRTS